MWVSRKKFEDLLSRVKGCEEDVKIVDRRLQRWEESMSLVTLQLEALQDLAKQQGWARIHTPSKWQWIQKPERPPTTQERP